MDETPVVGNPVTILHVRRVWKDKDNNSFLLIFKLVCLFSLVRSDRTEILLEIFSVNIRRSNILKPTTGYHFR